MFTFCISLFMFVFYSNCFSQGDTTSVDSAGIIKQDTSIFKMQKSPTTAILYSLAFPGLGQIYTERYWKAPVFAGAASTLWYLIFYNNSKFNDYSDSYNLEIGIDPKSLKLDSLKAWREYYRDNRDLSAFFLLGVYVLAAVDAYSDSHLFDFKISGAKFAIIPETGRCFQPQVRLRIDF